MWEERLHIFATHNYWADIGTYHHYPGVTRFRCCTHLYRSVNHLQRFRPLMSVFQVWPVALSLTFAGVCNLNNSSAISAKKKEKKNLQKCNCDLKIEMLNRIRDFEFCRYLSKFIADKKKAKMIGPNCFNCLTELSVYTL